MKLGHRVPIKRACHYLPSVDGIVCRQPERYFNRPLYCSNRPSVVLAGEWPAWILARETLCLGRLQPRIQFGVKRWTFRHPYHLVTTFQGNRVEYAWASGQSAQLTLEVYPAVAGTGCWIGVTSASKEPVILDLPWTGICVSQIDQAGLNGMDPARNRELIKGSLGKSEPRIGHVTFHGDQVRAVIPQPAYNTIVSETGKSSTYHPKLPCRMEPVNDPVTAILKWSHGRATPARGSGAVAMLSMVLTPDHPQAWVWWGEEAFLPRSWDEGDAARAFQIDRCSATRTATPSAALDTGMPHAVAAMEGCYYPPFFVHGAMSWNHPYLGWSIFYGGVALGWSERLRREFTLAFAAQETNEATDPWQRTEDLTMAGSHSHFYGRGHVDFQQYRYNMQEVFFDQVIEAQAHRLLGDLWPQAQKALDEHVAWEKRCFDPTDRGLFESCINTWASDSVWYNGGAGPIATAYNYRANLALGRPAEARRIRQAANTALWLKRKGWYAEYQDPGPEPALHESACLYSVYLPITCGMADAFQSWQLLQYAQFELENVTFPDHPGRLCWLSQWVPYHWSVRELGHGETLMLAQAAFLAGDAELGWDYLRGVIYDSQYANIVPGGLQMAGQAAGKRVQSCTDFGDPVSIYPWTVSRGLAGFRPVPNGPLRWEPAFPKGWSRASLQFPNHGVSFRRTGGKDTWSFRQLAGQELELNLPLPGCRAIQVRVDGRAVPFAIRANCGAPRVHLAITSAATHQITVQAKGDTPWQARPRSRPCSPGGLWKFRAPRRCRILEVNDPQGALTNLERDGRSVRGTLAGLPGHRLLFMKLQAGECQWWQPVAIWIKLVHPTNRCLVPRKTGRGTTEPVSLETWFNGPIKDLCAKQCREPRPQTCGAQIGIDGYSPWTYGLWKTGAPEIDSSVWHQHQPHLVVDGIPFLRPEGDKDGVLVSRWSHLPREIVLPINARLNRLYILLVVNTSVMQAHQDVLRLTLRGGSQEWSFPLNHPRDVLSGIHRYDPTFDRTALPQRMPRRTKLGNGLDGCVLQLTLPRPELVQELKWECLALETIGGLLGVTLLR